MSKRQNIELVLGFLDAIRRRDRQAAAAFLDPKIGSQGVVRDVSCHAPDQALGIFFDQRDRHIKVDGLELTGTVSGAC